MKNFLLCGCYTCLDLDSLTKTADYSQVINEPTHFINRIYPCLDSILFSNPDLVQDCKIEQSLYGKCHH